MNHRCLLGVLVVALPAAAHPRHELPRYTLEVPAGWTVSVEGDRWLARPAGTTDFALLGAGDPVTLAGRSAQQAFAARWRELKGERPVLEETPAETVQEAGRTWQMRSAALEGDEGASVLVYVATEVEGRLEGFLVASSLEALEEHLPGAERIILSARFRPAAATPRPPTTPPASDASPLSAAPAGRLAGVWATYRPGAQASAAGPAIGPKLEVLLLLPDGSLLRKLPLEGLETFDAARERRLWERWWGTYELNGERLRLRAPGVDQELVVGPDRALTRRWRGPDGAEREGETWAPRACPEGLVLAGEGRRSDHWRSAGEPPALRFARDGRFEDRGLIKIVAGTSSEEPWEAYQVRTAPGAGRYHVRRFTITLRYDDGRVSRLAFLPLSADGTHFALGGESVVEVR